MVYVSLRPAHGHLFREYRVLDRWVSSEDKLATTALQLFLRRRSAKDLYQVELQEIRHASGRIVSALALFSREKPNGQFGKPTRYLILISDRPAADLRQEPKE